MKQMINVNDYCKQLLEQIACELNVKEVRLKVAEHTFTFHYDTIKRTVPDQNLGWASLIFSGDVLEDMKTVREVVAKGLKQRSDAGIKVRQPLQSITIELLERGDEHD